MIKSRPKRIVLAVTNDLEGDQRIHKVARSLQKKDWEPLLVGRLLHDSQPLKRPYRYKRIRLLFSRGPVFYACFNLRLFLYLLFVRADLFVANDLDTLAAVWLASRLRKVPMIYDSHEYFTEVPELQNRHRVKSIWKSIERKIQPKIRHVITVNESIAELFRNEYHQEVTVVKNLPPADVNEPIEGSLPDHFTSKPIIIYQGAVNVGRGLEEMLMAMKKLREFNFLIVGGGDRLDVLQRMVADEKLDQQVYFTGRVPFESLAWYTKKAAIGMSLEQDIGLNYRLSLPNKLFDYMRAGIPVIASDLPEIKAHVKEIGFGKVSKDFSPSSLAICVRSIWEDKELYEKYRQNALKSLDNYTWEKQELVLFELYEKAFSQ